MAERDDPEDVGEGYDPEEEIVDGTWSVKVNLPEMPVTTGEEEEDVVVKFRSKLYRWNDKQWKERGVGELKLLRHTKSQRIRLLMRQEKTHKIVANHYIYESGPLNKLTKQQTSEKAWVWQSHDFSDGIPSVEKLCARFTSVEDYNKFKEEFEKAYDENTKIMAKEGKSEKKEEKPAEKEQEK